MPLAQLLEAQQCAEHLASPNWVVLDCRFALDAPQAGRQNYQLGHIPGAHFADLEEDLSAPVIAGKTGRHPLPDSQQLLQKLQHWGINNDSQVLLYDDNNGAFAARAWWLLNWLGKSEGVWLLNGGFKAWQQAGLPVDNAPPKVSKGNFQGQPNNQYVISAEQLMARLNDPDLCLLDARALPRFKGEVEPLDPVAGHIPGAQCASFSDNLDSDGRFLTPEQLKQRFATLLNGRDSQQLVAYCGSGVTACHNLFALSLAGYPLAPLYAGSWSEWVTDTSRPVARG